MTTRPYDIVLFGATGFTGQLTAAYLLRQGAPVRLALAGRNREKLEQIRAQLLADVPGATPPDIVLADSGNPDSLEKLCAQARVIITTVGPYQLHGEPLVAACVSQGCDYVDLTGEPLWVMEMQKKYGEAAEARGVRIVNCCGFDSIPHDLGVFFTLRELEKRLGRDMLESATSKVEGFVRAHGDFSGGTWNSAINAMARWRDLLRERKSQVRRALTPGRKVKVVEKPDLRKLPDGWAVPMPTIDPSIVVRSAACYDFYGKQFSYSHFVVSPQLHRIALTTAAIAGIFVVAQVPAGLKWLGDRRPSGAGPAPEKRATHWFTVDFTAEVSGAQPLQVLRTQVSGRDPGYDDTAKMLAESALCLALDRDRLPANHGVVTPAEAMGDALLTRLQNAGMGFMVKG